MTSGVTGIYTYNPFGCFTSNPTRTDVTHILQQANAITRNVSMMNNTYLPAITILGTITTIAAGIFLGAPFFLIAAAITTGLVITGLNRRAKDIEDIESITSYFGTRKPFKFSDGDSEEKVVSHFKVQLGYDIFVLVKVPQKAN